MDDLNLGAAPAAPVIAPVIEGDDLTKIKGIGEQTAGKLRDAGIKTYQQIADLNIDEAERLEEATGLKGHITNFRWRAQARQMLGMEVPQATKPLRPSRAAGHLGIDEVLADPPTEIEPQEAPAATANDEISFLKSQLDELRKQLGIKRPAPAQTRFTRIIPMAKDGPIRHRLNRNRKYSDLIGIDVNLMPPGVIHQQIILEDGAKRVAYFDNQDFQRFMSDEDYDDINMENVEPEHEATIETFNPRNYLNGRAEYPLALAVAYMKERFGFDGRSHKEIKEELHRMINQNRS